MKVTQFDAARHLLAVNCGLIGMVLLAIGAHAALDLHTSDAKAMSTEESASANRLALIIGNGHYPDSAEPLSQPINDASGLADAAMGSMSMWWRMPPRQIWLARSSG